MTPEQMDEALKLFKRTDLPPDTSFIVPQSFIDAVYNHTVFTPNPFFQRRPKSWEERLTDAIAYRSLRARRRRLRWRVIAGVRLVRYRLRTAGAVLLGRHECWDGDE